MFIILEFQFLDCAVIDYIVCEILLITEFEMVKLDELNDKDFDNVHVEDSEDVVVVD